MQPELEAAGGDPPRVSVIMAVRDEERSIAAALGSLLAQDYPPQRFEVLIADGRSRDATRARIEDTAGAHFCRGAGAPAAPPVRLLDNPGRIAASGLNVALRAAEGELILRVDGHVVLPPDYVRTCVEELLRSGAANVGGRCVSEGRGWFGAAVALAMSSPFGVGDSQFRLRRDAGRGLRDVDTVPFGCWRRRLFARIGGFDEELVRNQDDEHNYRVRKAGGRVLLSERIRTRYQVREHPGALWRQYFGYGFWKVRVLQKHPAQMRARQFAPPALWGALLLGGCLPPAGAALGGLYLGGLLLAAAWTARREPTRVLPVALAFAILHGAYGLGFLCGLLRFWRRWGPQAPVPAPWTPHPIGAA